MRRFKHLMMPRGHSIASNTYVIANLVRNICITSTAYCCTYFSYSVAHVGKLTGPFGWSNWETAKRTCEELGQKLLTIDSQEEENIVASNIDGGII